MLGPSDSSCCINDDLKQVVSHNKSEMRVESPRTHASKHNNSTQAREADNDESAELKSHDTERDFSPQKSISEGDPQQETTRMMYGSLTKVDPTLIELKVISAENTLLGSASKPAQLF